MEIQLKGKKGGTTIVSESDHKYLSKYNWHINDVGYAEGYITGVTVLMHRYILGIMDSNKIIDHINNNKLDNRRENLRITTTQINALNRKNNKNKKSSIFKGVNYSKRKNKYDVFHTSNNKAIYLGAYEKEIDAAECFDLYIIHNNMEEYVTLNFPEKIDIYRNKKFIKPVRYKTHEYIGVGKLYGKYTARVWISNKSILVLRSKNPLECARAYDKYVYENNIPNKKLNFPENYPYYNPNSIVKTKYKKTENNNVIQIIINSNPNIKVYIDESDYDKVKYYSWYLNKKYICAHINGKIIRLSRFIMNVDNPDIWIDHIDSNRLNNCKNNLRISDPNKNSQNKSKMTRETSSIYMGVCFRKHRKVWDSCLRIYYNRINIGSFNSQIHAARARDLYILIHHSEEHFKLNFKWNPGDIESWKEKLTTRYNFRKWIPKSSEEKILEKTSRIVQNLSSGNDLMVEKLLSLQKRNSKFKAMEQFNWLNSHNTPKQSTLERSARIATLLSNDDLLEVEKLLLVQKENTKSYLKKLIF